MSLNKVRGNMYNWVDFTWNPIRGECPHQCVYCFMKDRKVGPLRLDEKALADNLAFGRTIFVGSSTDMFAEAVPDEWIIRVLERCNEEWGAGLYPNKYVFQSKNPGRFFHFSAKFPTRTTLGTTLESNREYGQSGKGPPAWRRASWLSHLRLFKKMVSIEPIMAFDHKEFLDWMREIKPAFVSIGADSKGHNLPEPTASELDNFVVALRDITEVKLKKNLDRLLLERRNE